MKENEYQELRQAVEIPDVTDVAPVEVLFAGGVCVGTMGEFSTIVGKPKVKKTFNVIAIAAAALSGKEVAGWRVELPEGKQTVAYIDTEQSRMHTERTRKRICLAAGVETAEQRLRVLNLKKMSDDERLEFVPAFLARENSIGLVILDGIRDLVEDINDNKAAHHVAQLAIKWADLYACHIVTTLHVNKSDKSPRGHLGTEATAKAESVIMLEKEKDSDATKVSPLEMRDIEFTPFRMTVSEDGLPIIC